MNAGVACGGVKSLPATASVSSGLSLIRLFTEDPPLGHFLSPRALASVSPCTSNRSLIDHPLHLCWLDVSPSLLPLTLNLTASPLRIPLHPRPSLSVTLQIWPKPGDYINQVHLYYMPTRYVEMSLIGSVAEFHRFPLWSLLYMMSVVGGSCGLLIKDITCDETVTLTFVLPILCSLAVVQRVDSVSEGIANYGGKIIAVETDLKKLGKFYVQRGTKVWDQI